MEPYRNNQEVFDAVAKHLLVQNEKSQVLGVYSNRCLYRGPGCRKCAIGALIPDDVYALRMESLPVDSLMEGFPDVAKLFVNVELDMLECLQETHDNYPPEGWRGQLCRIADSYELSPSILEEL